MTGCLVDLIQVFHPEVIGHVFLQKVLMLFSARLNQKQHVKSPLGTLQVLVDAICLYSCMYRDEAHLSQCTCLRLEQLRKV